MKYYPSGQPIEPKAPISPVLPERSAQTGYDETYDAMTFSQFLHWLQRLSEEKGFDLANCKIFPCHEYEGGQATFRVAWTILEEDEKYKTKMAKYLLDLEEYQAKMEEYEKEHAEFRKEHHLWFNKAIRPLL